MKITNDDTLSKIRANYESAKYTIKNVRIITGLSKMIKMTQFFEEDEKLTQDDIINLALFDYFKKHKGAIDAAVAEGAKPISV